MNAIDLILIAILALGFISGLQKGFLTSVLATFAFVGAWLIARAAGPQLAKLFLNSQFKSWLSINVSFDGLYSSVCASSQPLSGVDITALTSALTQGGLPQALTGAITSSLQAGLAAGLTVGSYVSETIWQGVFNVCGFVLVFGFSYALLLLAVNLINNVFTVPKLKAVDAPLGALLGLLRAYIIICILLSSLPVIISPMASGVAEQLLSGSKLGSVFNSSSSILSDLFGVGSSIAKIAASNIAF